MRCRSISACHRRCCELGASILRYTPLGHTGCNNNDTSGTGNAASISRSLKPSKALLGVHQIWVHNSHRQKGIASKLVTAARDHLIFGMLVPYELVAFSSPTEEGLRFAKSYIDSERPLIYDIHWVTSSLVCRLVANKQNFNNAAMSIHTNIVSSWSIR